MPFDPKDERELQNALCWPAGIYDFEVIAAEHKISSKGNAMLALTLKIFHPDTGAERKVKDWLVESDAPGCLIKLNHYCQTTGAMDAYESGTLDDFPGMGATGKCKLAVENSPDWGAQNKVADYIKPTEPREEKPSDRGVPASQTKRANAAFQDAVIDDSEIPFSWLIAAVLVPTLSLIA